MLLALALGLSASEALAAPAAPTGDSVISPSSQHDDRQPDATPRTGQETSLSPLIVTARLPELGLQSAAVNTITVLTPRDWTRTPDLNVAEILSRAPGVTVIDGGYGNTNGVPVDQAARGQGNFVSLRGLDAEFNVNLINGVEVAEGKPYSRAVQLNLLPPAGLHQIIVNKTARASMDGDAIGGIVDFHTPTAFDYERDRFLSLQLTGQIAGRALSYGQAAGGGGIAMAAARRGAQFGVYASAYYDQQNFANTIIDGIYPAQVNGMFAYTAQTADGDSAPGLDPASNLTLTGLNVGVSAGRTERYGGALSLDWRSAANDEFYVRATYAHEETEQETSYLQIYGNRIGAIEDPYSGLFGPVIGFVQPRYYYETNPESAALATLQTGGAFTAGRFRFTPNIFFSYGRNDEPDHIEISARLPEVAPGFPFGGARLFSYDNGRPIAMLGAGELNATTNIAAYGARRSGELTVETSRQTKYGVKFDAEYDLGGGRTISSGVKLIRSDRRHTNRDYNTRPLFTSDADDPSFGSLGILQGSVSRLAPPAYDFSLPLVDRGAVFNLFNSAIAREFGSLVAASDQCGQLIVNSENCDTQRGSEVTGAFYSTGSFWIRDIEVEPGVRYEKTRIRNTFWVIPPDVDGRDAPGAFQSNRSRYDKVLPSLFLVYRPGPLTAYRLGVWTSYVLPSLFQLGGGTQIVNRGGGAANGGTTLITEGNPDLKAIDALNIDLSGEWSDGSNTGVRLAIFYKSIQNYIFSSRNDYTNATSVTDGSTIITRPQNGGDGQLYGLELSGRKAFAGLPLPYGGLGVAGNLTIERSSVDTGLPGLSRHERLLNQPDLAANVQLFYESAALQVDVSYRYTGNYVAEYGTLGPSSQLDTWVGENHRLDLHVGYRVGRRARVDFQIANLLGVDSYKASVGEHSRLITSRVNTGRTYLFKLGFQY